MRLHQLTERWPSEEMATAAMHALKDGPVSVHLAPEAPDTVEIEGIYSRQRWQGLASKALRQIVTKADENNITLVLSALALDDADDVPMLDDDGLRDWYGRAGFALQDDGITMIRAPRGTTK